MAILGLAVASTFAQTQSTTSSTSYIQTSKFIGRPVKSAQGDEIGTVKDIVLDRNTGCLAYTVLSTTGGGGGGTRVSGGGKMVAVPWAVYSPSSDPNVLTVTVERDRIYNAPVFDYARIEEYSRPDYINECLQLLRRKRRSGSWGWCFWRHFNDHNRRNHDNWGDHNDRRGNRCEHNGRRGSKPGGR